MAIELFEHNLQAYNAAVSTLAEAGKAAVIHPTGTGKSFIAFKYCEDHPEQTVLWLSPSEYIFRTQCEKLLATGAEVPGNIAFMTYAKLSRMEREELSALQSDVLVLDELHRAAAPTWEQPVQTLLARQPGPLVIGLTATHIRYLDGQKDTVAAFGLTVASEMTLGEAIVRGILQAPIYVLSVYSCQKDYEKLKARVQHAKNGAVRDEAEKYLEALRRALEQADGLDTVFERHVQERTGKYLVFCANAEHMREMMSHVPEWFGKIDAAPHVYSAYSDDPETSRAFADFRADDSKHLKLLFCIDMLNEGVHVEGVSGVILFRPTISPIIYKQQIGRALSASGTAEPIIFDIVNNIYNLYSIGSVEEEMQAALSFYRLRGEERMIVNERFRILDELGNARELFERLNDTLTASWELMYELAKAYYEEHGDLLVPYRYRTAEGYSLGRWIHAQREARSAEQGTGLNAHRIALLDRIGMEWRDRDEQAWQQYYEALCRYKDHYGDIDVKSNYVDDDGIALGMFIAGIRASRRDGKRSAFLTEEHIAQLDGLGMIWDRFDYSWERHYQACAKYYVEHGSLDVPSEFVLDGFRIGAWIRRQRMLRDKKAEGVITPERIKRLDDIGMIWTDTHAIRWENRYRQVKRWYEAYGSLKSLGSSQSTDAKNLCAWLRRQKKARREGKLTENQIGLLTAIGLEWEVSDPWEIGYAHAERYYAENHNLNLKIDYTCEDGFRLGVWLANQKKNHNKPGGNRSLSEDQVKRLEKIGVVWQMAEERWTEGYCHAMMYINKLDGAQWQLNYVSPDGYRTGEWLRNQLRAIKRGRMKEDHLAALRNLGLTQDKEPMPSYSRHRQYVSERREEPHV